jgi:type IV pilus assembly protein PilC
MAQTSNAVRSVKKDQAFKWEGRDRKGLKVTGRLVAANEQAVRGELRRQGIATTRVKKQTTGGGGGKVNAGDIAIFSRQ